MWSTLFSRPATPPAFPWLASLAALAALALLLGACAPHRDLPAPAPPPPDVETPAPPSPAPSPGPSPRTVYIIHGDADYLYHDARGARKRADEEALREARAAARSPDAGEVFVFHQRTGPWRRFAGGRAGTFEHYRAGVLTEKITYSRMRGGFQDEAAVIRERIPPGRGAPAGASLRLAYFGHEIIGSPARNGHGKDLKEPDAGHAPASSPDAPLDQERFARGLQRLAVAFGASPQPARDTSRPYELVVLSTCYGGTPEMMRALVPVTDLVVASPAYLHLSYLDARALARSGAGGPQEARALADTIAQASFQRLRAYTTTEITVAIYDLREAAPPVVAVVGTAEGAQAPRPASWDDCARDGSWDSDESSRGVTLHYQPPRFGPHKDRAVRSAWQCRF